MNKIRAILVYFSVPVCLFASNYSLKLIRSVFWFLLNSSKLHNFVPRLQVGRECRDLRQGGLENDTTEWVSDLYRRSLFLSVVVKSVFE